MLDLVKTNFHRTKEKWFCNLRIESWCFKSRYGGYRLGWMIFCETLEAVECFSVLSWVELLPFINIASSILKKGCSVHSMVLISAEKSYS